MRGLSASINPFTSITAYITAFVLVLLPILTGGMVLSQEIQLNTKRQSVSFPATAVGSASGAVTIPLLVHADGTTINTISAQPSAGEKYEYAVQSIGCVLNVALPSGTICNVGVTFKPVYAGERPVPLRVETSAGNFYFGMEGLGLGPQVALYPAIVNTVAGNGSSTLSGDGGPAINAGVPVPLGTALDSAGNLYIADALDGVIRKIAANTGIISTVAGSNGSQGFGGDHGSAVNAQLNVPTSVAVDSSGNLYIADNGNNFIRKVSATTGDISTVVGIGHYIKIPGIPPGPPTGFSGDGGLATGAILNSPDGLFFDATDDLYFADSGNNVIRRVDAATNIITTVAGNHKAGRSGDGGAATSAELNNPSSVAVDNAGNLFIADLENDVVRKVTAATGVITTIAGTGTAGFSGDGGPATSAELHNPSGVSVDTAGNLYIVDSNNGRIREVSAGSGVITTIAGTGAAGFSGDGQSATSAALNFPNGVALDGTGNLYIADSLNNRIRWVNVLDSQLYFSPTPIGFSSLDSPQTATVTNIGNSPLVFSVPGRGLNPSVSPNFGLSSSSTCPQLDISSSNESLSVGSSCNLLLSFTPIQTGSIVGSADISDNAVSIPPYVQTVRLSGTGLPASAGRSDFQLSVTPSNQTTYSTSEPAIYTVTVNGIYGFAGNVALAATGLPAGVNATFTPASVTLSGASAMSTFTVIVPQTLAESTPPEDRSPGHGSTLRYGLLLLSLPLLGILRQRKQLRSVRGKAVSLIILLVSLEAAAAGAIGCDNIGLELQPQTYDVTIDGTSGNLQRSTTVMLTLETYRKVKYH